MGTTRDDIREWLESAKTQGYSHVIVVCDTFDHEDYPVCVARNESVRERIKEYDNKNMQRIMEVYSLNLPIEEQLAEHRAYHLD